MRIATCASLFILSIAAAPLAHAAIPKPVRAMLQAAIDSGNEADIKSVAKIAKQTNPDDAAAIDAMVSAHFAEVKAEKEAELASGGVFDNWSGEGELGAFRSTGNTSNTGVTLGLKLKREGLKWSHSLRALADFQRTNGVTTKEQYRVTYEPRYKFGMRLFAYGLGQYERDRFQGFSARYSASGGLGYKVIAGDDIELSVQGGPAWRKTEFTAGGSDSSPAGLASLDFNWRITDTLSFSQDASAYLESGNSTLISTTALDARLIGALSARLSYTVEYESDPPAGRVGTDTLSRATLVYGF